MNKYIVMIEGEGILVGNRKTRQGFYTTRFVEANVRAEAEIIALEQVRKELRSRNINVDDDSSNIFKLNIDEVTEVSSFGDCKVPGGGFTFFDEDNPEVETGGIWEGLIEYKNKTKQN